MNHLSGRQFGKFALSAAATIAIILTGLVSEPVQALGRQISLGTITGAVTDEQGVLLPNVAILLKNQDTGVSQSTHTDARGVFILHVAPGMNYSVTAEFEGFEKVTAKKLPIPLGNPTRLDIKLSIGPRTII